MKGIVFGIIFSIVIWGLILFGISFISKAKAEDFNCLLIGQGRIEIDSEITIRGENFTSLIHCNIQAKRKAFYLGGPWCLGRKILFRGVKSRINKLYTCRVVNFLYDEDYTAD